MELQQWIKQISLYPVSEIFAGTSQQKAEKRVEKICDELYKLSFPNGQVNVLADVRNAFRELEIVVKLNLKGTKLDYINKVESEFLTCTKIAISALDEMHKKDPLLQEYYKTWKISNATMKSLVYDYTSQIKLECS